MNHLIKTTVFTCALCTLSGCKIKSEELSSLSQIKPDYELKTELSDIPVQAPSTLSDLLFGKSNMTFDVSLNARIKANDPDDGQLDDVELTQGDILLIRVEYEENTITQDPLGANAVIFFQDFAAIEQGNFYVTNAADLTPFSFQHDIDNGAYKITTLTNLYLVMKRGSDEIITKIDPGMLHIPQPTAPKPLTAAVVANTYALSQGVPDGDFLQTILNNWPGDSLTRIVTDGPIQWTGTRNMCSHTVDMAVATNCQLVTYDPTQTVPGTTVSMPGTPFSATQADLGFDFETNQTNDCASEVDPLLFETARPNAKGDLINIFQAGLGLYNPHYGRSQLTLREILQTNGYDFASTAINSSNQQTPELWNCSADITMNDSAQYDELLDGDYQDDGSLTVSSKASSELPLFGGDIHTFDAFVQTETGGLSLVNTQPYQYPPGLSFGIDPGIIVGPYGP